VAHYFVSQAASSQYVTAVDFRAPATPVKQDTSAAAIAACGLLQLAGLVPDGEKEFYRDAAERLLGALADGYCDWNPGTDGIVQNGTAQYHDKPEEANVPLIYGDYFFMEAVGTLNGSVPAVW
jgi:unsaturated chondroitin disaccharide hydrolase